MISPKTNQQQQQQSQTLNFHQTLTTLQSNLSSILTTFTTHLNTHLSNFAISPNLHPNPNLNLNFARIEPARVNPAPKLGPMSSEEIEERLAGVPVYALSNADEEFVLVRGGRTGKSLGLFCFRKEDADALLDQMRSMDPDMRRGSGVVAVALNKVFQLKVKGVAFRMIPEASQIKNALREKEKAGSSEEEFSGVPVFQSRSLILRSQDKRYRPVFFRKEDLENSLLRASRQQKRLNPMLRQGDIEVANLEDIIKSMKEDSSSKWGDVVFIPPGFDVSTDPNSISSKIQTLGSIVGQLWTVVRLSLPDETPDFYPPLQETFLSYLLKRPKQKEE